MSKTLATLVWDVINLTPQIWKKKTQEVWIPIERYTENLKKIIYSFNIILCGIETITKSKTSLQQKVDEALDSICSENPLDSKNTNYMTIHIKQKDKNA